MGCSDSGMGCGDGDGGCNGMGCNGSDVGCIDGDMDMDYSDMSYGGVLCLMHFFYIS